MENANRRRTISGCLFIALAGGTAVVDLWTKDAIWELIGVVQAGDPPSVIHQERLHIIPNFFTLEATYNRGAFYGIFAGHTGWLAVLSALAVVVIVVILYVAMRQPTLPSVWFVVALGLICGGTLGNFYDRALIGAVRDWIKWYVVWNGDEKVWPNFNIADSGICVGVSLLILLEIVNSVRTKRAAKETAVES